MADAVWGGGGFGTRLNMNLREDKGYSYGVFSSIIQFRESGIWRALGSAHWNLEAHSAEAFEGFPGLGALAAIPAGQSVVVGETIPYTPSGLAKREEGSDN